MLKTIASLIGYFVIICGALIMIGTIVMVSSNFLWGRIQNAYDLGWLRRAVCFYETSKPSPKEKFKDQPRID